MKFADEIIKYISFISNKNNWGKYIHVFNVEVRMHMNGEYSIHKLN